MRGISFGLAVFLLPMSVACEEVRVRPIDTPSSRSDVDESGSTPTEEALPTLGLAESLRPIAISAGFYNTCVVLTDGRVACFGDNRAAFNLTDEPEPLLIVDNVEGRKAVALGKTRACAWEERGSFICWPGRWSGQRRVSSEHVPGTFSGAVGRDHVCAAFGEDGHVRCLGSDDYLQSQSPFGHRQWWVDGVADVAEVAAGATHTCARHEDGTVTCWGDNRLNQMGDGSDRVRARPGRVPDLEGVRQLASHATASQTCALLEDASIRCWGSHGVTRAGGAVALSPEGPVDLEAVPGATRISVGPWEICAVGEAGRVYCVHQSVASAQGDTEVPVYDAPRAVPSIEGAIDVAVGAMHACALVEAGDVYCWGTNTNGQLGDGTQEERTKPVLASILSGLTEREGEP